MSYLSIEYLAEAERNVFALQGEYASIKTSLVHSWKGDAALEAVRLAEQNLAGLAALGAQIGSLSAMIQRAMQDKESSEFEEMSGEE